MFEIFTVIYQGELNLKNWDTNKREATKLCFGFKESLKSIHLDI